MKKIKEFKGFDKLSISELFQIKGGASLLESCDSLSCRTLSCNSGSCTSGSCNTQSCSSRSCNTLSDSAEPK